MVDNDVEVIKVRATASNQLRFGSEAYHALVQKLLMEAHNAYAGFTEFHWLNAAPCGKYDPNETHDWFIAGRAFGCVLRKEHGGTGVWTDMQMAWLESFSKVFEEHGFFPPIELDGGARMPERCVQKLHDYLKKGRI